MSHKRCKWLICAADPCARKGSPKIIPLHQRPCPPAYFLAAAILMLLLSAASSAFAGSATWNLNPTSGDWNTATNWTPATVPNGPADTATFDVSSTTDVYFAVLGTFEVDGIVFNSSASAFTITFPFFALTISGAGITNNSGITQNFVVNVQSRILFLNSATAGSGTAFTNVFGGEIERGGFTQFFDTSTAGNGTLVAKGGVDGGLGGSIQFNGSSTGVGARVEVFDNGNLDVGLHSAPGVTVGSIEGSGAVFLGAKNLTVGSNNLSTTFSGVILGNPELTTLPGAVYGRVLLMQGRFKESLQMLTKALAMARECQLEREESIAQALMARIDRQG
jgi:hypothetical protein